jgi:hypothetical protein
MADATKLDRGQIQDHMPVVGSDGRQIGVVDAVEGEFIRLTRTSPEAGGKHRWVPLSTVAGLDGGLVRLSMPSHQAEAEAITTEEERERALILGGADAARFGVTDDDAPHGSRGHKRGLKGQREHGMSGQASGPPGQTSFGVHRPVPGDPGPDGARIRNLDRGGEER